MQPLRDKCNRLLLLLAPLAGKGKALLIRAAPLAEKCWRRLYPFWISCVNWWLQKKATQRLVAVVGAERPFSVLMRTGTTVDTGRWFLRGRLSIGLLDDELLLLAPGRRPFVVRAKRPEVAASLYNAVTGELVLAPASGFRQRKVRLSPVDGYAILRWVQVGKTEKEDNHA
ncbi:MAG: hypothetical protein H7831_16720 [Magnetococcus sp. WYHC-3]